AHVVTNLTCMVDHLPLTRFLIVCIKSSKISLERCLGVNHNRFAARQPDNHVRAQTTPIAFDGSLLDKINMLGHSRHFEHVLQLILAPADTCLRSSQCLHQTACFRPQSHLPVRQVFHLLGNCAVSTYTGLF